DYEFDEFDKPGAGRAHRKRGEDDTLDSDLEGDLLEEDWPSGKKNASEVSDEELNDDLLQSDEEDIGMSGQDVSLNAAYSLGTSYDQQDNLQGAEYTDDVVNQGEQGFEGQAGEEGYQHEGEEDYAEDYGQDSNVEISEKQMDYGGEGYQDEVLDIHINEPLDGEFQFESETLPEVETKEESDDEDEEDEESGRVRFRSERKEGVVVRLADANKRRNIPETLGTICSC
uniref:RNA-binding protein 33 n=2 Tax=Tetraodon nigroviridis TaxID=99883 RepID=H3D5G2_TETNG